MLINLCGGWPLHGERKQKHWFEKVDQEEDSKVKCFVNKNEKGTSIGTYLLTWFCSCHGMYRWIMDIGRSPVIEVDSDGEGV